MCGNEGFILREIKKSIEKDIESYHFRLIALDLEEDTEEPQKLTLTSEDLHASFGKELGVLANVNVLCFYINNYDSDIEIQVAFIDIDLNIFSDENMLVQLDDCIINSFDQSACNYFISSNKHGLNSIYYTNFFKYVVYNCIDLSSVSDINKDVIYESTNSSISGFPFWPHSEKDLFRFKVNLVLDLSKLSYEDLKVITNNFVSLCNKYSVTEHDITFTIKIPGGSLLSYIQKITTHSNVSSLNFITANVKTPVYLDLSSCKHDIEKLRGLHLEDFVYNCFITCLLHLSGEPLVTDSGLISDYESMMEVLYYKVSKLSRFRKNIRGILGKK